MTDPFVSIAFFAIVLLAFCAVAGTAELMLKRRDDRRAARNMRRRINRYGAQR